MKNDKIQSTDKRAKKTSVSSPKSMSMTATLVLIITLVLVLCGVNLWLNHTVEDEGISSTATASTSAVDIEAVASETEIPAELDLSVVVQEDTVPQLTAEEQVHSILDSMSLEEKIYQLFVVTPEQLTEFSGTVTAAGETTKLAIQARPVGGVIYFEPNIVSRSQCEEMISNIQSYSKLGLFIAVDEEGGRVSRLGNNPNMGTTQFPAAQETGSRGENAVYTMYKTIGREIGEVGFNLDLAPVADINFTGEENGIGSRALSTDAKTTAKLLTAAVRGFKESNMLCCLKHFPGQGATVTDTHNGQATIDKTRSELEKEEFLPFKAGIKEGADCVMIGHTTLPNATSDGLPATLSKEIITDLLRNSLGFNGLIITDSLQMKAITNDYSSSEAAVMAFTAGADVILMPVDLNAAFSGLSDAISNGIITEERLDESVLKILEVKLEHGIISVE